MTTVSLQEDFDYSLNIIVYMYSVSLYITIFISFNSAEELIRPDTATTKEDDSDGQRDFRWHGIPQRQQVRPPGSSCQKLHGS